MATMVRLLPDIPLPPYSYVPGLLPHPISDPAGHSFGQGHSTPVSIDPERWAESREFLHACDLFNSGFYWESHEAWEGLWRAAGRDSAAGQLLQGLIKLAAAGVKVRQGIAAGTVSLALGACELFANCAGRLPGRDRFLGLSLSQLCEFACLALTCATDQADTNPGVRIVFPFVLCPEQGNTP